MTYREALEKLNDGIVGAARAYDAASVKSNKRAFAKWVKARETYGDLVDAMQSHNAHLDEDIPANVMLQFPL